MKGWLVHLKDDLLEMNEWKSLFKANGKECNVLFFFPRIFLKVFKYIPMGEKKDPIIYHTGVFILGLSGSVLLTDFMVVSASQTLKCMIL